jgi:hypothetical protein
MPVAALQLEVVDLVGRQVALLRQVAEVIRHVRRVELRLLGQSSLREVAPRAKLPAHTHGIAVRLAGVNGLSVDEPRALVDRQHRQQQLSHHLTSDRKKSPAYRLHYQLASLQNFFAVIPTRS